MAQWLSVGVDALRGEDLGDAVGGHDHGPFAFVHEVVVEAAQQAAVAKVGRSAVLPGRDVVGFGPGGWPVDPGRGAAGALES